MTRPPRCPDCDEQFLNYDFDCPECDYSANPPMMDPEDDPADLREAEYERRFDLEAYLEVTEWSEINSTTEPKTRIPFVEVMLMGVGGREFVKVPMVGRGMPFNGGWLMKVVQIGTRSPGIAGVYNTTDGPRTVTWSFHSDECDIREGDEDDLTRGYDDILWRADHPRTTDPFNDIMFPEANDD